jgi:NitT/TauT family transport system substrate-binding protein
VKEPNLAGQLWVKGEPRVRLYSTVQATFTALARLQAEGRPVRVTFVHDRVSGNKLFAEKAWYVKAGGPMVAFLLKSAATEWSARHGGTVVGVEAARADATLVQR